nr:hypothetical protein [Tanacetum cinerariifolium]
MGKRHRGTRGQPSSSQEISIEEKVPRLGAFEEGVHQMHFETLARRHIHSGDVIDWEFLVQHNLDQEFSNSICTDPFFGPQWGNLFLINEPIYRELVREFFALFDFDASHSRSNPSHLEERVEYRVLTTCVQEKKSMIAMGVNMELHGGMCVWPGVVAMEEEEDEGDDQGVREDTGRGKAGGSADFYYDMSQGDWQAHQAHWMG